MRVEPDFIPLMYQAQVDGRAQIQRLIPSQKVDQQAYDWAGEWQEACDTERLPQFGRDVQTREYTFTWRMVTNSGQDVGVIRPVIGARGWAFFPGSSMKGAFRRSCRRMHPDKLKEFCGGEDQDGEICPGILRFMGGYPKDDEWLDDSLVDIVHPQEDWQGKGQSHHSALIQISLLQPTFVFGISCTQGLSEIEWQTVWDIWQDAAERGLGSRVTAGYGQIATHSGNKLVGFGLIGQGAASRRIDQEGEFRPNLFKAALRGHTRRLFHGITTEVNAERLTKLFWGGIGRGEDATVGLLGTAFHAPQLALDEWVGNNRNNRVPVYETGAAQLDLLLMKADLTDAQQQELRSWMINLVKFAMLLGGFGRAWRRADHRLFMPKYDRQMIGCHWQFSKRSHKLYIPPRNDLTGITRFLDTFTQQVTQLSWVKELGTLGMPSKTYREAWRKDNVQVWGRLAQAEDDSVAIQWLHQDYQRGQRIKQSELTGKMGAIGRLWHRMYPRFSIKKNEQGESIWKPTSEYVELLTIFPNVDNRDQQDIIQTFLTYLEEGTDFQRLW
jgi:CRISPR-associated protein Cmr6